MGRTVTVILAATFGVGVFASCDDSGVDRRSALMAGCKTDKDCPPGTVCEKHNCRTPDPKAQAAKKKAEAKAAKASAKANAEAAPNTADLTVRLCPGYWGKSQNTGTMIAKNLATGKKKYLRLNVVVQDEDFEDEFVFKAMPYGRYEVTAFTGVIAQGKQDLLSVDCAERQACAPDNKRRLIDHAAPPPKEEWEKMLKKWQKEEWPGTQKCPKNHECDEASLLRPPCDFDVDREMDTGKK